MVKIILKQMKYIVSNSLLLVFTILLFSCKQNVKSEKIEQQLILTDSLQNLISVDTAIMRYITTPLNLSGQVAFVEDKMVEIFPLFGGNVVEIYAELGSYVKKGSPLATIRSSEVADFQQQEIEAQANLEIAEKDLDVANDMAKSGLSSRKEILFAQKKLDNARAQLKKIKEIISIYNISGNSLYSLKSPVSGFVVKKNITREMQLRSDNNHNVFTISGLDEVWIIANVYESDISKIKLNNPAQVKISAFPKKIWNTKIEKIYNILDPESKTMMVRMKLSNHDYKLKPGMFAQVQTTNSQLKAEREVSINKNALIFNNNNQYVVIIKPDNTFEVKEIKVKTITGDYAAIMSGLNENDRVVNENALLIFNAITAN
ncbi:MAG: efflux RND transporter periplasmic adaptor subunit [Bacteroidales bacterium]|nr:efflux RND transporter periplasmic adaptor subunit [Bacteroidales bacterium]MDD4683689.1 efflux RND transporter periplasmic adaptor subunit [Bacteroidales bacterium]